MFLPLLPPCVPLLSRSADVLQVGLDDSAGLIQGPAALWRQLLVGLDGRRDRAGVERLAEECGLDPEVACRLVEDLVARGIVVDAAARRVPARPAPTIYALGDPVLTVPLRDLLEAEGLSTAAPAVSQVMDGHPDLVVVASRSLAVDRVQVEQLRRADLPHLLMHASATGAVVGPLIVPGVTACLLCLDLRRSDADPDWPHLVPLLQTFPMPWSPGLTAWALGLAVAEIRRFLAAGEQPAALTVELSRPEHVQRLRQWSPHPECSCQHW